MARVLVVGMDLAGERAVLARLAQAAPGGADAVLPARDLDGCDVLVVGDSPGLRATVSRMLVARPGMDVLVQAGDGELHDLRVRTGGALDAVRLVALMARHAAPAGGNDAAADAAFARGAKPVTRLLRANLRAGSGQLLLAIDDAPAALLDFAADQALCLSSAPAQSRDWAACLGQDFDRASLHAVDPALAAPPSAQLRQPLRPLLWQAAATSAHWRDLDARLARQARIHLLRWPDFRVLAHRPEAFRLCSLLLKRASTLEECSELLQIGRGDVLAFAHPAYLCGYAQIDAVQSPPPCPPVRGEGSLLARMWRGMRAMGGA